MEKPKFSFGDHIYFARVECAPTYAPCVSCGGKGYVTIIYEGETFTIDCEDCRQGYLGSNGCRGAHVYTPDVVGGIICGVERDSFEPYDFEYRMAIDGVSRWIMKEHDVFWTKEDALARAQVLKEELDAEQARKLAGKSKPDKSWAWHVRYYQQQIKDAEKTIAYASLQLDAAKKHVKEKP
jgi:hypothetical protein